MTQQEKELQSTIVRLEKEVAILTEQFKNFNSIRRNFFIAVLRGFASALGATVVFGLAIALVIQIVRSIDYVPLLNGIMNSGAIEEVIQKFSQPLQ
jgi:hypothetical protein